MTVAIQVDLDVIVRVPDYYLDAYKELIVNAEEVGSTGMASVKVEGVAVPAQ
jgi:hypothetical protein